MPLLTQRNGLYSFPGRATIESRCDDPFDAFVLGKGTVLWVYGETITKIDCTNKTYLFVQCMYNKLRGTVYCRDGFREDDPIVLQKSFIIGNRGFHWDQLCRFQFASIFGLKTRLDRAWFDSHLGNVYGSMAQTIWRNNHYDTSKT